MTKTDAIENEAIDLSVVDEVVERIGRGDENTVPILQALQAEYRYLPTEALARVAEITDITPAQLTGVASFYGQFRHKPSGRHFINVCVGTACHVAGAEDIYDAYRDHLGITGDEDTDEERLWTVQKVACLGCCTLAVAVKIGDVIYGHVAPATVGETLENYLELEAEQGNKDEAEAEVPVGEQVAEIRIGVDSADIARGSADVYEALLKSVRDAGLDVHVKTVGSMGMAYMTPLVEIVPVDGGESTWYANIQPGDARDIVYRHFRPGLVQRTCHAASQTLDSILTDEVWGPVTRHSVSFRDPQVADFSDRQKRIATEHAGRLSPTSLDQYLELDGFKGLERVIKEMSSEEVIHEVAESGLRGRGGGGYPTGLKWSQVRQQPGGKKYLVCNGDEGDPGAFMDRMLLECYPYRIIEGMAIAAYAVGADEGYLYVRAEYPLAIERVKAAIERAEEEGYLGEGILGTDFNLKLHVMEGAGAFVCGEETALMRSIMGNRGMPVLRPPYPAQNGLWGQPTLVNNTETYACIPWIVRNGWKAFADLGQEKSRGTKVFALAGKINRGGLIEVPMGITVREIIEEVGGGIPEGKAFKAVQIGGPSGGCIPADLIDTPINYEVLTTLGAMMGSGGLVVLDESDCMVEVARYFLEFTQDESCGKCTFCRIGTRRMLEILTGLTQGRGKGSDIEELEGLADVIAKGSLCGLGKTAPNPVLTTLKYFRDEYDAHVEGRCPAGKCKSLITYEITDECIGCTLCAQNCPTDAVPLRPHEIHEIDQELCVECGTCFNVCPVDAVRILSGPDLAETAESLAKRGDRTAPTADQAEGDPQQD